MTSRPRSSGRSTCSSAPTPRRAPSCAPGAVTVEISGSKARNPVLIASLVLTFFAILNVGLVMRATAPMKGHPIRGFVAGLLLGICSTSTCSSAASSSRQLRDPRDPARRVHRGRVPAGPVGPDRPQPQAEGNRPSEPPPAAGTGRVAGSRADRAPESILAASVERTPRPASGAAPSVAADLTARRHHAGMRRWTSTTHPKKPPGAPNAAPGSRPTHRRSPTPPTATRAPCSSPAARPISSGPAGGRR